MEELFVYALLYSIGYERHAEYRDSLDRLFLFNQQDEVLLDLEGRAYKDAMLHLLLLMNEISYDINHFGRILMSKLIEIYKTESVGVFGQKMYELWKGLPQNICNEDPFYILSYADDSLSWGDEKQCRRIYEDAFNYYDEK